MENIDRMKLIGASEVPAILGLDSFCTPLKLWAIKTGTIPADDLSDNEACEWGTRLERLVSEKFAELHNVKLMAYKKRFVHPDMPFFSCELDNIICGTEELVEIKTVNAHSWKQWDKADELPAKVIAQVMAQMGLSGRKRAWISCLCGGQRYIEKQVSFDKEFYTMIETKVRSFWAMVESKKPPEAMAADNDSIVGIYPKAGELIQLVEEMNASIGLLQQLKSDMKALDDQKEELEAKLKQIIGENAGIQTSEYVAKWIPTNASNYMVNRLAGKMLRITKNKDIQA